MSPLEAFNCILLEAWSAEPTVTDEIDEWTEIVRAALAEAQADAEPNWRHPKLQSLIGREARRNIEMQIVEDIVRRDDYEPSSMDGEYWLPIHDELFALKERAVGNQELTTAEPVAWPCDVDGVDFDTNTLTLTMRCNDYRINAGIHYLMPSPPRRESAESAELSEAQVNRQSLKASECPPDSVVMLVSTLRRLGVLRAAGGKE